MNLKETTLSRLNVNKFKKFNKITNKSLFLSYDWLSFLGEIYNKDPKISYYFNKKKQIEFFLPFIDKFTRTSTKSVSLPLCVIPLSSFHNLEKFISALRNKTDEVYFHSSNLIEGTAIVDNFYLSTLDMNKYSNSEKLFNSLNKSNIQRKVLKAMKQNFTLIVDGNKKLFEEFENLQSKTRHRQGSPDYPKNFFKNLTKFLKNKVKIFGVKENDKLIAATVFFWDKNSNRAIYAYGANDEKYLTKNRGANQLAMWLGIEYAKKNNFRYLDFGKTPLSNKSLLTYKERWGAKTENCFMLVHPKKATKLDVKRDSYFFLIFSKLMRILPFNIYKFISGTIFKYL